MKDSPDKPLNVIGIETSGAVGSLALLRNGELVQERLFGEGLQHARDLVHALGALLDTHRLQPSEIQLYGVGMGPGSYTGLRVGVTTARALAYTSASEVVGVPTMEALVRNVGELAQVACTVIDAKRGELYMQLFKRTTEGWVSELPAGVARPEDLAEAIPQEAVLLGDALEAHGGFFQERGFGLAPEVLWRPRASAVAELALELLKERGGDDVHTLVPVYLRRPAAEEKRLGIR